MNTPISESQARSLTSPPPERTPATPAPAALGSAVSADLAALKNDVEQARELACEYQRQLAGKSNDHAILKSLFEKTQHDLFQLHKGIAELREERHRFANDAMKATALGLELERMTQERDQLQSEIQALRNARASEADERVIRLTREVERLRGELRLRNPPAAAPVAPAKVRRPPEMITVAFSEGGWDEESLSIVATEVDPGHVAGKWRRR